MSDFVKASNVFLDNPATTVDEVFDFLSSKAVDLGISSDKQAVLDAFKDREAQGTTGMLEGFAIPHAKTPAVREPAVIVVKFAGDVEWASMDKKPIRVAIALLVPEADAGTAYLETLSKVAVLLMDEKFRAAVNDAADADAIAKVVNDSIDAR